MYNLVLKPTLLALKPGTRIVSHDYGIDDWEPDAQEKIAVPEKKAGAEKASWIYYWVVPAQVQRRWRARQTAGRIPDDGVNSNRVIVGYHVGAVLPRRAEGVQSPRR